MNSIERIIKALNLEQKYRDMVVKQIQSFGATLSDDDYNILTDKAKEIANISTPMIIDGIKNIYIDLFSNKELADLAEWYENDTGAKVIENYDFISQKSFSIVSEAISKAFDSLGIPKEGSHNNTPSPLFKDLN